MDRGLSHSANAYINLTLLGELDTNARRTSLASSAHLFLHADDTVSDGNRERNHSILRKLVSSLSPRILPLLSTIVTH